MSTYIIVSRFSPEAFDNPKHFLELAEQVSKKIKQECPNVKWKDSYATLGRFDVIDAECVGCNLCSLVCPAEGCITMKRRETGHPMATWQDVQRDPAAHPHLFARGH